MKTVEEARSLIMANIPKPRFEKVAIEKCCNKVLAQNIISPIDLPPYDQSAMDGFAVSYRDILKGIRIFSVNGEVKAGVVPKYPAGQGKAVRIFTGAMIPKGASCVVMQEHVAYNGRDINFNVRKVKPGDHIRSRGSQIKQGRISMKKNAVLNPAGAGFLASMGLKTVFVYKNPHVSIVATGNELHLRKGKLLPGKIFESNKVCLISILKHMNIEKSGTFHSRDTMGALKNIFRKVIKQSDIVLFTGGVSVGKYDLVKQMLEGAGVTTILHGIKQKPGKPLYAGKKGNTLFFGLPGNPAAALTCFYEYVYPVIRKMQGFSSVSLRKALLKTTLTIEKKPGRALFVKAKTHGTDVIPLTGQESYILKSFAEADSLIYLPASADKIRVNDHVEVHLLPETTLNYA